MSAPEALKVSAKIRRALSARVSSTSRNVIIPPVDCAIPLSLATATPSLFLCITLTRESVDPILLNSSDVRSVLPSLINTASQSGYVCRHNDC